MNILHLSDIHFGRNYACYGLEDKFEKKTQILEALLTCIGNIDNNLKPEHIVVTGDIAWHGKKNEYEEAIIWFEKLLKITQLTGKDITFCAGNHDANRSYASVDVTYTDETIKEIDEIYDYKNVHKMEAPFFNYDWFCEKLGVEPFIYPLDDEVEYSYSLGYKDVKFPSGKIIRIFAFNTALLSALSTISEDKMWIGQTQIRELIKYGVMPADGYVHFSIALLHHAERFLHPNEICEYDDRIATMTLLKENVDLVLCGHTETGGKPVLQKQVGGAMLLTAGATYYSDTHPNAFSMLYIPDNKKDMLFQPYVYKDNWKIYEYQSTFEKETEIKKMPPLGEIREQCRLVVKAGEEKYEILMKFATIYAYQKEGEIFIRITNEKEVLRKLNIECIGPALGGTATVTVDLAPKMERNVAAILERERYFAFLDKALRIDANTEFRVESISGERILSGNSLKGSVEVDSDGIEILRNLAKIELFYDIRFWRPDDIYELDEKKIKLILELIDNGYTNKFQMGQVVEVGLEQLKNMKELYVRMTRNNSVYLYYIGEFSCDLFGKKFSLGDISILSGEYMVDLDDLKRKIETYEDGDMRKIILRAKSNYKTFFVTDEKKANDSLEIKMDSEILQLPPMNLNFGFIKEEDRKTKLGEGYYPKGEINFFAKSEGFVI